jgi:hypothetical protein
LLHQHWPDPARDVRFLVVDGATGSIKDLNHKDIAPFGSDAETLARQLDEIGPADVFLHYAGRAYHRYGCPSWLPPVLAGWKRKFPAGRLLVLFHELPGNFSILSRYYWIDLCNRRVIRRLAKSADALVTNTAEHARKLENMTDRAKVEWFPVPSNIPVEASHGSSRARGEFVVFGLPFGRWQTLQMFDPHIRAWIGSDRLTRLHIVGPPDERLDARSEELIAQWPKPDVVQHHGMLPASGVSNVLSRVQFGLVNATMANWSKSAVFMAFASHGCAIVMKNKSDARPLRFTVAADEVPAIDEADLDERTRALRTWYEGHADWNVIAEKISSFLPGTVRLEALS